MPADKGSGRVEGEYGKFCHCIGVFRHMPDRDRAAPSAQRGGSERAEATDHHYVQLPCAECGLSAGADRACAGGRDGGNYLLSKMWAPLLCRSVIVGLFISIVI